MVKTALKNKKQPVSATELLRLRRWNRWLAIIYAFEGIAIFLFGTAYSVPVIINYLAVDPISSATAGHTVLSAATRQLFNISIPGVIALLLLVTAFAHGLLVTFHRRRYEAGLVQGVNILRWLEYAITAGLMLMLIGILSGISDLATLIAIFGFMVIMCLLGLVTELTSKDLHSNWLSYWCGAIAGFIPWIIIAMYAFNATYYGSAHIPTFVYWIYATMILCTMGFALNVYLHCKKQGNWSDYTYTERNFMILGFVTKSLLAWQIFVGILRP